MFQKEKMSIHPEIADQELKQKIGQALEAGEEYTYDKVFEALRSTFPNDPEIIKLLESEEGKSRIIRLVASTHFNRIDNLTLRWHGFKK